MDKITNDMLICRVDSSFKIFEIRNRSKDDNKGKINFRKNFWYKLKRIESGVYRFENYYHNWSLLEDLNNSKNVGKLFYIDDDEFDNTFKTSNENRNLKIDEIFNR